MAKTKSPIEPIESPVNMGATTTNPPVNANGSTYDPFDPVNLRVDQNYIESSGVRKLITTIPVRKPNRQTFFRIHPADEKGPWSDTLHIVDLKDDREEYIVGKRMVQDLK
jgi:hypothetical protein